MILASLVVHIRRIDVPKRIYDFPKMMLFFPWTLVLAHSDLLLDLLLRLVDLLFLDLLLFLGGLLVTENNGKPGCRCSRMRDTRTRSNLVHTTGVRPLGTRVATLTRLHESKGGLRTNAASIRFGGGHERRKLKGNSLGDVGSGFRSNSSRTRVLTFQLEKARLELSDLLFQRRLVDLQLLDQTGLMRFGKTQRLRLLFRLAEGCRQAVDIGPHLSLPELIRETDIHGLDLLE